MDRVTTQTSSQALQTIDQAFQTLDRAFGFLWKLKNLVQMFGKLDQKFERFRKLVVRVFWSKGTLRIFENLFCKSSLYKLKPKTSCDFSKDCDISAFRSKIFHSVQMFFSSDIALLSQILRIFTWVANITN